MAADTVSLKNRKVKVHGNAPKDKMFLINARVLEGLSRLTETRMELILNDADFDIAKLLGHRLTVEVQPTSESSQKIYFGGLCVSVEEAGVWKTYRRLIAEVRPWLWFLTQTVNTRIFQDMNALGVIKKVLEEHGFVGDLQDKTTETRGSRTYCVQYDESDFDFISRLMEQEGIYYYFTENGTDANMKLVLCDGVRGHLPVPGASSIEYHPMEESGYRRNTEHIFDFRAGRQTSGGKVTLQDFDFEKSSNPTTALKVTVENQAETAAKSSIPQGAYESYVYPGRYDTTDLGQSRARVSMESIAAHRNTSLAMSNVRGLRVGQTFKMDKHPVSNNNTDYLVTWADHRIRAEAGSEVWAEAKFEPLSGRDNSDVFQDDNTDEYQNLFNVTLKTQPFRAPQTTKWPRIAGLLTATVTGPSGEEIYTDKYGRIKVQFHWDRVQKKDEKSSCWVRCVMPWTGKSWGMISVPRIGQEVAIQFENGDPDRPICTGMLYNDQTLPPYKLPENMTQTGIVTRSTKTGNTQTFNELIFEDKKDAEFVRLQSEKDYLVKIKNNAVIDIGLDKKDPGDLTQTIHHTKTETIKTGDHNFKVEEGNQTIFVKTDHTETIEGTSTQRITGDTSVEITEGDYSQTITQGNVRREVSKGDENHTIAMGDWTVDVSLGSIDISAAQKISLTVGGSSVVIEPSGVTISGPTIAITGDATVDVSSPATSVGGDMSLMLTGGTVMIN